MARKQLSKTPAPRPTEGGSYIRARDGALTKVARTIAIGEPDHQAGAVPPAAAPAPVEPQEG